MEQVSQEEAWNGYRAAIERLYDRPLSEMTDGQGEIDPSTSSEALDEYAGAVVESSQRLGDVLSRGMDLDNPSSVRELAALQLVGVASIDLAVANDLAERQEEDEGTFATGVPETQLPGVVSEVLPLVERPPEVGIEAVLGEEGPGRAGTRPSPE